MGTVAERWSAFRLRLMVLFRKARLQNEMAEELAFHQAMLREKLARQGGPPTEVEDKMRRRFGNLDRWRERCSELWQFSALENFLRDLSFSARLLRKSPGFTAVAILTLALGVGANTAVFSLIDGLLLRPLPVPQANRLAVLGMVQGEMNYVLSMPVFRALEKRNDIFQNVFAYHGHNFQLHEAAGTKSIPGALVSGQYFDALRTPPKLGRYLTVADDTTGGNPNGLAVVISEGFWKTHFDSARDIIGRKMTLDNVLFTVVGVMPKRFIGADPINRPDIFAALATEPLVDAPYNMTASGWHAWWLTVDARLRPTLTLAQTNAALRAASQPILDEAIPASADWMPAGSKRSQVYFAAESGSRGYSYLRDRFRKPLMLIFSLCAAVLMLACLNLVSLLMARAAAREREISTRLAVGATRRRLMQQLLVESLLLATLGTGAGMALSPLASHALAALLTSGPNGSHLDTSPDLRVLLFGALIAMVSTVLIGIAPALQATSGNLNDRMKDASRALHAHERRRLLPRLLLATEVALAFILVVGAGLLSTSLMRLHRIGLGFDPHHLVLLPLTMEKQPLDGDALLGLYREFSEQLSHQPGVASISYADITPLAGSITVGGFNVPSGPDREIYMAKISPGYFHTMRIPMLVGRGFHWNDTPATGQKIVLNQAAAKLMFPNGKALGRQIKGLGSSYEVVGIAGNTKYVNLRDADPPTAYVSITQNPMKKPSYMAIVRASGPVAPIALAARSIAARLAPEIPSPVMLSMDQQIDQTLTSERMMAMLSIFFAACALLVTGIGLYGTLAYTTARRTSEIGIRIALGAQRIQVVLLIFRENVLVASTGAVAGIGIAIAASRAMTSFLYGTSPRDPWVLLLSALALGLIASAASLLPAIRAARIDPMVAIRCE